MNREELVRANFDVSADRIWAESLEAKFKQEGVDGAELASYRKAWNRRTEERDWEWWKKRAQKYSTQELADMLAEGVKELDALGVEQWWNRKGGHSEDKLQKILDVGKDQAPTQPQTPSMTQEKGRKR